MNYWLVTKIWPVLLSMLWVILLKMFVWFTELVSFLVFMSNLLNILVDHMISVNIPSLKAEILAGTYICIPCIWVDFTKTNTHKIFFLWSICKILFHSFLLLFHALQWRISLAWEESNSKKANEFYNYIFIQKTLSGSTKWYSYKTKEFQQQCQLHHWYPYLQPKSI